MALDFRIEGFWPNEELRGTGIIIFPLRSMRSLYILAGEEVLLRLPDERELILRVGASITDEESIRLDDEYSFLREDYDPHERVRIIKGDFTLPQADKVTLLLEKGMDVNSIKRWLASRRAININALYIIGGRRAAFVEEGGGISAASVSKGSLKRIYYLNDMGHWRDHWHEYLGVLRNKREEERKNKKILGDIQENKDNIENLKKGLLSHIKKSKGLLSILKGLKLIEGILTEELRLKLQQQKDLYTRIRERDDNDFLDLEGHGRTKISMIKGKLDEIFADNLPGEEPICEEICNYYEETQTIKDAEKALEDIGVSDSVHFFPPKGSDFSEDLEEEISKVRNIIEEYKTKNAELDKEKEKISEEVQELTLKEQCVSSSCSRMKEEMDHKQKEVTNKIEGLLELSEGYSPCGEIIEEIKRRIIPLHSLEEPEEIKKHFEEIYRRLKFLQTALERAEPWLRERKKRKM